MVTIDSDTAHALRLFAQRVAQRFEVVSAMLYGSRARGTHQPHSDADVAVILRGKRGGQRRLSVTWAMSDIAFDVLLDTKLNISPLVLWSDEWGDPELFSNPELIHNIRKDGIYIEL